MSDVSLGGSGLAPAEPGLARRAAPRRITTGFPAIALIASTPDIYVSAVSGAPTKAPRNIDPFLSEAGCVVATVTQAVNSP